MLNIFSACMCTTCYTLEFVLHFLGGVSVYKLASSFTYHIIIKIENRSNKARQCEPILQQMNKNNANLTLRTCWNYQH